MPLLGLDKGIFFDCQPLEMNLTDQIRSGSGMTVRIPRTWHATPEYAFLRFVVPAEEGDEQDAEWDPISTYRKET